MAKREMNKPFIEIDAEHFTLSPFETKPIEGYEVPINEETGENFPNCCPFHKDVYTICEDWFKTFPNCCKEHKAMASKWWYKKENYNGIEKKIVTQLSYTEHHIEKKIETTDWYKDITDYIEYNVSSFGQPAIGLDKYLGNVQHYIENTSIEIPKEKKKQLNDFLDTYYNPTKTKKSEKTDLNILFSTYQKWLKTFPFDISFFANLKEHYEKQLPIINGKPEPNKYTGLSKVKVHTKSSLINVLTNLTNNLLTQVNSISLYEKGTLTEPDKIKLELILTERKMKLNKGYVNKSQDEEQQYRKILKEWYADEKQFIDEITPLLKELPPQPIRTKEDIFKESLIIGGFYNLEKVQNISETGQTKLIQLLLSSMAYGIAMFDFLGFCHFLDNEKGTMYKSNQYLSKLYNENAKDGTQARHYRSSLVNNKPRYTSYLHKEKVIKDYEQLK